MIVAEHSIRSIVSQIPEVQIRDNLSLNPVFHWGDEKELNRFIELKKENSYPLIWLLPSRDEFEGSRFQHLIKECSFIVATRETRTDLFNDQRYIRSFDLVLNPLVEYLVKGLTSSNISEIQEQEYSLFKHPNYSADSDDNATIDIWDAIELNIKVKFKDNINCLKPIFT
tara:strand:- start:12623 stop:13132 length:510 start_codon:yes stop_codon:yes gene_type:complete